MPEDNSSSSTPSRTPVLSREEARARRKRLLAAMERAEMERAATGEPGDSDNSDSADAALATMILPGD